MHFTFSGLQINALTLWNNREVTAQSVPLSQARTESEFFSQDCSTFIQTSKFQIPPSHESL